MTPELRAALSQIGWDRLRSQYPITALELLSVLEPPSPPIATGPKDARASAERLLKLAKAMVKVVDGLDALSDGQARTINHWSATPEELDKGIPDKVSAVRAVICELGHGIGILDEQLRHEAAKSEIGQPRYAREHEIAGRLAIAFWLGTGKRPTYGRDPKDNTPDTAFNRALASVLEAVGFHVGDVTHFAKKAKERSTQEALNAAREANSDYFERVRARRASLFDFALVEKLDRND